MKKDNKKVQYALLGMVLLIWGTIAYRMMNWNSTDEVYNFSSNAIVPIADANQNFRDSFVVKANYRDPFLEGKKFTPSTNAANTGVSSKKYQRKAPPSVKGLEKKSGIKPPKLKYLGYSLNENEVTRVRISIDGKAFTFKINEKKEKIKVKEMYKDSVIVRHRGKEQTLYRKK